MNLTEGVINSQESYITTYRLPSIYLYMMFINASYINTYIHKYVYVLYLWIDVRGSFTGASNENGLYLYSNSYMNIQIGIFR